MEILHGVEIADPYRWLEHADDPDVRAWVDAQNRLTQSWLSEVGTRPALRRRLADRWDHPRLGAPWRRGARWFQMRNSGLQDQSVLWTMDAPAAAGRVLLDPNELSPDGTVALAAAAVSEHGELLAYATSDAGSDWMTWRVRDVSSGTDRDDVLEWSKFSGAAWTHDHAGFYYSVYDPPPPGEAYEARNLNQRLQYHRLGAAQQSDRVVVERPDQPEWGFDASVTEDGRWLVVHVWQGTDPRNRVWVAPIADGRDGELRRLLDDFDAAYHVIGAVGDELVVLTDLDAPRRRIVAIDLTRPAREHWREVVPQPEDTIERARLVGGRLITVGLHHASHRVEQYGLDGGTHGDIALPDLATVDSLTGRNADPDLHLTYATFTAATAVARHHIAAARTETIVPPPVEVADAVTEQRFVRSTDGVDVPVFLVHRRDVQPSGDVPTLLYGYGGFDIALTPMFKVWWSVWLELGGLLAVPNLRGGGEYGREWHDGGRLARKQQTFDDAIAVAEWLCDSGWTRPSRLALNGGSNGGLLVGACLTQRPDLFGACVPEVGVLDMLRFHKFTIGWGWASDYGTADDPEQFRTLLAYSPLHRIAPGTAYPPTLVTTGDHDDRVVPGHSFKFAAALQSAQSADAPILIRVETSAGHGAATPTSKLIDQRADVLAFLVGALGMEVDG